MFPPNLLINADDFGLNPRVSRDIFQCVQKGLIHSISVLPFKDTDRESLEWLNQIQRDYPHIQIGAHLSLIETYPILLDTPRYSSHQASPNNFQEFLGMYFRGRMRPAQVKREWRAQLQHLAQRLGGPHRIAHMDSHQHVHVLPGLWPVATQLKREFEISRLRVPYENWFRSLGFRFPFGLAFQTLALWRSVFNESQSHRFGGFFTSTHFNVADHAGFPEMVIRSPHIPVELMVHPDSQEMEELGKLREWFALMTTAKTKDGSGGFH